MDVGEDYDCIPFVEDPDALISILKNRDENSHLNILSSTDRFSFYRSQRGKLYYRMTPQKRDRVMGSGKIISHTDSFKRINVTPKKRMLGFSCVQSERKAKHPSLNNDPLISRNYTDVKIVPSAHASTELKDKSKKCLTFNFDNLFSDCDKKLVSKNDLDGSKSPNKTIKCSDNTKPDLEGNFCLSMAELDDIFQQNEDSTICFESLESRLKTPVTSRCSNFQNIRENFNSKPDGFDNLSALNLCISDEQEKRIDGNALVDLNDDYFPESNTFHRSFSCDKLESIKVEGTQQIVVERCFSQNNLSNADKELEPLVPCDWIQKAINDLAFNRQQQLELEASFEAIRRRADLRRQKFKAFWGVSPRNIKKLRQDLMLERRTKKHNVDEDHCLMFEHEVSFSEEAKASFVEDEDEIVDKNMDSTGDVLFQSLLPLKVSQMGQDSFINSDSNLLLGDKEVESQRKHPSTPFYFQHISNKAKLQEAALLTSPVASRLKI